MPPGLTTEAAVLSRDGRSSELTACAGLASGDGSSSSCEPRATPAARLALGAAFLRAVRFSFLRSVLSVTVFVFISFFSILRIFLLVFSARNEGS